MMRLAGTTAIVTGAASGIGAGIARRFVAEGARVVVADRDLRAAEALAGELGPAAFVRVVDVADGASVAALVRGCVTEFGRLDILVNNAGVGHAPVALEALPEEAFERVFAVNCRALYWFARELVPVMKAQGGGAILNVASTAAVSPRPGLTWYNASKGWLVTATRSMAIELAPFRIRVNAINPVASDTPLLRMFMGEDTPEMRAKFLATIPLGRFALPQDHAAAAAFLCSQDAAMITGVALEVDGGRCI